MNHTEKVAFLKDAVATYPTPPITISSDGFKVGATSFTFDDIALIFEATQLINEDLFYGRSKVQNNLVSSLNDLSSALELKSCHEESQAISQIADSIANYISLAGG